MNRELNFALNFGKANADLSNALKRAIDELKTITHSGAKFLLADDKVQEIRLMIDNLESMKKSDRQIQKDFEANLKLLS